MARDDNAVHDFLEMHALAQLQLNSEYIVAAPDDVSLL